MEENRSVESLINEVVAILAKNNISDGQIMERTGHKYSKPTIANFRKIRSANPNLETFVDICNAAGIKIRLVTEQSEKTEIRDNISEYRLMFSEVCDQRDKLAAESESANRRIDSMTATISRLVETNGVLSENLRRGGERYDALNDRYQKLIEMR